MIGNICATIFRTTDMKSRSHLLCSVLYIVEFLLAYIVMLSVMTYNVCILVAAVLGSLAALQLCPVFSAGLVKKCLGLSNANTEPGSEQPEEKPLRDDQKM